MAIDVGRLEDQLVQMSGEGAPGREFCDSIAELARTGRFALLRDVLPSLVYDELWERYRQNPGAFVAGWRRMAQEMRQGFIHHARQRLTSLTRLQHASSLSTTPVWQSIQRALDAQQNDLLRAAFALELLGLVEPAVLRATHLRECVVSAPSSEEADRYLDEATRCYFFGLFTACAPQLCLPSRIACSIARARSLSGAKTSSRFSVAKAASRCPLPHSTTARFRPAPSSTGSRLKTDAHKRSASATRCCCAAIKARLPAASESSGSAWIALAYSAAAICVSPESCSRRPSCACSS